MTIKQVGVAVLLVASVFPVAIGQAAERECDRWVKLVEGELRERKEALEKATGAARQRIQEIVVKTRPLQFRTPSVPTLFSTSGAAPLEKCGRPFAAWRPSSEVLSSTTSGARSTRIETPGSNCGVFRTGRQAGLDIVSGEDSSKSGWRREG